MAPIDGQSMALDRARVTLLLPGIRRGFIVSAVPITMLSVLMIGAGLRGAVPWLVIRVALTVGLAVYTNRLGDGLDDPHHTLDRLCVIMAIGGIGWGLLPVMIEADTTEWWALMVFAIVGNLSIVTVSCAADRRVYLSAAVPVFVLGSIGLATRDATPPAVAWMLLLVGPYSYVMFLTPNRTLLRSFEASLHNEQLLHELEAKQTDLTSANDRLRDAAERQSMLLEERSALISAVGHDLGSPLGAALITSELLADRADQLGPMQRQELARRIHGDVRHSIEILSDLTSTQGLSDADIAARRRRVSVADVAEPMVRLHREAGRSIHCVQPGATLPVWAEPVLLGRIVDNLVTNAMKHCRSDALIEIGAHRAGDECHVWVDDDGPGLPVGMHDSAFAPYVRGASARSARGTGLGLFLVRTFAELHGGRAWWEPSGRGGSRFVVSFPEPTAAGTPDAAREDADQRPRRDSNSQPTG
jgi:signal transduction histidine kinase